MSNHKILKIAQIAPLWENIPPKRYGGTERVLFNLTEGLIKRGHNVTLFAAGTARTSANLISVYPRPLVDAGIPWTNITYPLLNLTAAFDLEKKFDIIHVHLNKASDYLALPLARYIKDKIVFTLHFPYPFSSKTQDRHRVFQKYKDLNYVSISNAQRQGGKNLNWLGTVYNGIDTKIYKFNPNPKNYFIWVGRFNPDKGVREAVMAAKKAKVNLILAGKLNPKGEPEDYAYYKAQIKPLVDGKQILHIKELDDKLKNHLMGNAIGFLNPIKWNEPFGLVMTESMATGTPVISFRAGAAPELIKHGKTGFLVKDTSEMSQKIRQIKKISRQDCRRRVEKYFSSDAMTENYVKIYKKIQRLR